MNIKSHQRIISKVFPINKTTLLIDLIILSLLGALAVVLRAKLRIPLNMPGHHGLEVMAILLIGRQLSKISIASSISSLVAGLFIFFPVFGFKDPFLPLYYVIMGISIDILYYFLIKTKINFLTFSLIGGLAYMLIPLCRLFILFLLEYEYVSFIKHGFVIPLISHFIFGFSGGLAAFGLVNFSKKQIQKRKQ